MPLTNMSIKIKAMCACSEEVTEKESAYQKQIENILLTARQHNVSIQTVAETIIDLLQARPAESKRKTRDKLIQEIAMRIAYALPYHYLGWVRRWHHYHPLPEELGVRLAPHPAQAAHRSFQALIAHHKIGVPELRLPKWVSNFSPG